MPDVCPWWAGYLIASPIRKLVQHPAKILSPYVKPGMTVVEPGPAMGFFTLELARLVGPSGRVVAVDIQARMLSSLRRRARRAGLADRIETRVVAPGSLGLDDLAGTADFVLAFAMVHEFRDDDRFFGQVAAALKPGGTVLLAEPAGHVGPDRWGAELESAARAGLTPVERPHVWHSHAALLRK
jgi:SAM-dependent methyltransferase